MATRDIKSLDLAGVRRLTPADFASEPMTSEEFELLAGVTGGYWRYLGEPRETAPHVRLASGLHSNAYFSCPKILAVSRICDIISAQMIRQLNLDQLGIDWVVGAALAAIPLVTAMGSQLNCCSGYVEKDDNGRLSGWRFEIPAGARVLVANEVMTTPDGSTFQIKQTVAEKNSHPVEFIPFAAVMVHRTEHNTLIDGTPVKPLFHFNIPTWDPSPETCPYCAAGSKAISGKINIAQMWRDQLAQTAGVQA